MPPSGGDDTAVQQAVRHKSHTYSVPWQGGGDGGKLAFVEAAKKLPHPSNDHHLSLPLDLLAVIELPCLSHSHVVSITSDPSLE